MRLATLTFIGALGATVMAIPAGAVPIVPEPLKSPYITEVADGCGLGFHRNPRGDCVSHAQYRSYSYNRPYRHYQGYPYSGGGYRTYQYNYGD